MTELKWNQPKDRTYETGLDRGVIYLEGGEAVPWSGLTAVEDGGETTLKELYIDGIKYLARVSPRNWKGSLEAFTYPDAFAKLLGMAELGDGLFADGQMPGRFGLSYRTMVGTADDTIQHYKIHLIYKVMASLGAFGNETLSNDAPSITSFKFDLAAVPIKIPGLRPSAHITIDTRTLSPQTRSTIEGMIYGNSLINASLPTIQSLIDILLFGDTVTIVDNGNHTWTATGSAKNVYMTSPTHFKIDNVAAVFINPNVYSFATEAVPTVAALLADSDGVPYVGTNVGSSNMAFDTDGVPYFAVGSNEASILQDTDEVYYINPN